MRGSHEVRNSAPRDAFAESLPLRLTQVQLQRDLLRKKAAERTEGFRHFQLRPRCLELGREAAGRREVSEQFNGSGTLWVFLTLKAERISALDLAAMAMTRQCPRLEPPKQAKASHLRHMDHC